MSTSDLIVLAVILFLPCDARAYQYILKSVPADAVIQSENFPASYPRDTNMTWEWKVQSGKWGVVFKEFHLDSGSESTDKLEISDRVRKTLAYTAHVPPVVPYISEGPQLVIHFVSDALSEPHTKGFKLLILYGVNEREMKIKIHEATKPGKESQEEKISPLLITTIAALTVIAVGIIFVVAILLLKNKQDKTNDNRDAFGVRRNSGISHSRRTRSQSSDESPQEDLQLPQQQQQPRIERPVQRSNSQLNWMARAELTTTIQKAGCAPRPNHYTSTDGLTNTSACSSKLASPTSKKSVSSSFAIGAAGINKHATRNYENSCEEYSETVDSLCHKAETTRNWNGNHLQEHGPPSYEESYPTQKSVQCNAERPMNSSNCYENTLSIACPSNPHQGNQTNIYINTGATCGSSRSINEITIDATKCFIKSTCCDNLEGTGSVEKAASNMDSREPKMVIYQNAPMNTPKRDKTPSVSSVQIIDGYAFIVPSSSHQDESGEHPSPS